MSNQTDHTIVRLRVPPELKQKIEESAEKNNRSQSAEMVARLESSFNEDTEKTLMLNLINASEKHTEALQRQIAISNLIMAQLVEKLPNEDPVKIKIKAMLTN
ncbi:Arc family DNA-binding protein [Acinetobacter chinensis]|uniref:Arc family DNA-binding protein n=1 Tax=Acinetobacter chinensis TaxID=2004650 RepID=UPI002934203B|nr:Arc family DNA-binding protein [Acinetobacter chinensis]WOE40694.1 Arc family DNA-binding protein [Acinetobacter chinensis]